MGSFLSSRRDGFVEDSRTSMPGSSRPTARLLFAMDLGWLPNVLLTTIGICSI